jgi:hypothetical protein
LLIAIALADLPGLESTKYTFVGLSEFIWPRASNVLINGSKLMLYITNTVAILHIQTKIPIKGAYTPTACWLVQPYSKNPAGIKKNEGLTADNLISGSTFSGPFSLWSRLMMRSECMPLNIELITSPTPRQR